MPKMAAGFGSLLRECPLLLPQNRERSIYEGFVTVQGRDFHIRILLPLDLQLKNARIECSWQIKKVLNGYQHILKQEVALKNTRALQSPALPPPQHYSGLIRDIETLGWDKVVFVDPSFSTIRLKAEDSCGRHHQIVLKLNPKYPTETPDCLVDLPVQFVISVDTQILKLPHPRFYRFAIDSEEEREKVKRNSLLSIHRQFLAALESLKAFWNALDEIDEKTWVLEPEKPTRSATMRRIAIGNNVSININVDPGHPTMLPECFFLGPDHVVNPLKIKLNSNIHMWDPEVSLLQNLKMVLEMDFPSREALETSDFSMDCGICYAYRLEGAIPDQVCDDSRCGQPFHQACLYEWLRGLPSSRQSFNVIFGECPYCSKQITLKMSVKKA